MHTKGARFMEIPKIIRELYNRFLKKLGYNFGLLEISPKF
jgi:hypothetical protein